LRGDISVVDSGLSRYTIIYTKSRTSKKTPELRGYVWSLDMYESLIRVFFEQFTERWGWRRGDRGVVCRTPAFTVII